MDRGGGSIPISAGCIPKRVSAICLLLKRQLPPKPQTPCFCGFVPWRQRASVLITILDHEKKEARHTEVEEKRPERKTEWHRYYLSLTGFFFQCKQDNFLLIYIIHYHTVCSHQMW